MNNNKIYKWLISGVVLIGLMVVIGGITRLTQSGLSMVEWKPIMGTLPPLTAEAWNEAFDLYKQSPEFKHYNSDFTLSDFKSIFFWEYLHRLLGRLIGLVFIIPFIWFWTKGYFSDKLKNQTIIILIWGAFQGVLGWLMVKSGLVDNPHVSHYRLAAHLVTAIGLMSYIFWVALPLKVKKTPIANSVSIYKAIKAFIVLVFIQLVYGAFVAGLKAGLMYNTFPKMDAGWIPAETSFVLDRFGLMAFFESGGLVQFVHRIIAYIVFGFAIYLFVQLKGIDKTLSRPIKLLLLFICIQITLGIITLLYAVPVTMGVLHQFGALLVLLCAVYILYISKPLTDENI